MANEKAVGLDGKQIEVEYYMESELHGRAIKDAMDKMFRTGMLPNAPKDVVIVIRVKQGSKLDCGKYRGITLISYLGKVLQCLILNRLNIVVD